MKIYLDTCSIQRPLDDRTQLRINIEAEAVIAVLSLVETGTLQLFSSEILIFEIKKIPNTYRRLQAEEILQLASHFIKLDENIKKQASNFVKAGVKPIDALHLASASWVKVDYFCTCDDKLLKKGNHLEELSTKVLSPLQLVAEVTL